MKYLSCLHCERPLNGRKRYCSVLCKSAVDKHMAKLRLVDDRHHEQTRRQPTYELTDIECLAIEARLAGSEILVFDDFHGFSIKDAHQETASANTNELHEPWASRGADLDVWRLRRVDRERFGGIVMTAELETEQYYVLALMAQFEFTKWAFSADPNNLSRKFDGLDSPSFHLKTFAFELDELYDSESETVIA